MQQYKYLKRADHRAGWRQSSLLVLKFSKLQLLCFQET
jgi:hypothetical protein